MPSQPVFPRTAWTQPKNMGELQHQHLHFTQWGFTDVYDNSLHCQCISCFSHAVTEAHSLRAHSPPRWAKHAGRNLRQLLMLHPKSAPLPTLFFSFKSSSGPQPMEWCQPQVSLPSSADLASSDSENCSQICPKLVSKAILNLVKLTVESNRQGQ